MLEDTKVAARISAQDLQRAKALYAEKLGLEPSVELPRGLLYRCGEGGSGSSSRWQKPGIPGCEPDGK